MENRIFPDNTVIRLARESGSGTHFARFTLLTCIGTGATCVAYQAEDEDGIPVRLKQFRPAGLSKSSSLFRSMEDRFLEAYRQQLSLMRDEKTAAVTSVLYGLYRDEAGYLWTSVNGMVGRTLDKLLPENSLGKNAEIIFRIAESVKAYHEAGWLLLDVKPENILVIDSLGMQGINFFDFDSFVRRTELEDAIAEDREVLLSSTESYSAPELLGGKIDLAEVGPAADFYSVGALLFTALFGRKPELYDCLPGSGYDFPAPQDSTGPVLPAEARDAAARFLHHTLTMTPEERYETDDALISALDEMRKQLEASRPQLSRGIPHAVSSFAGRERELAALSAAIGSSPAPLVVSGMGGIGKTQLVLKAAENLIKEYDFYYVPFQGSVRETILALSVENLNRETPDEAGDMVKLPDDEVYRKILACLRNSYSEHSVLIIDNFDASRDEETPSLLYDPDFGDLCSLPMRLIFTSRCRFDGLRSLPLEELEKDDILSLLREAFPGDTDTDLLNLSGAVSHHTLTLCILARTAQESKGKLSAVKLLQSLNSAAPGKFGEDVLGKLHSIFRAAGLSRIAKSVMACAGFFPQGGIRSDLLIPLLSPEQWLAANQLERSGWLRFDSYNSVWSVHPLVKAVCAAEKTVQPSWENVGSFVTALRKNQKAGTYEGIDSTGRHQLDEVFATVGRAAPHRPFPWKTVFAAAVLLIAVIAGFWYAGREADSSPLLTLMLFPDEEAAADDLAHDSAVLLNRLEALGIKDISLDDTSGQITASTRASVFGPVENMNDTVRLVISRPDVLYASSGRYVLHVCDLDRSMVRSAEARFGSIPQVGPEERKTAGLNLNADYPYLYLTLNEAAYSVIDGIYEDGEPFTFRFDQETFSDSLAFALAVPGEEPYSYYLLDGRWQGISVWQALACSLTQDPLHYPYRFSVKLDPGAAWQDPEALPEDIRGRYQQPIDALNGDTVTLFYSNPSPETISDRSFDDVLLVFRHRLDCLQLPYSIGTDYFDSRKIAVCLPTEHLAYDIAANILPASSFRIRASYPLDNLSFPSGTADYNASVMRKDDGFYALVLSLREDSTTKDDLETIRQYTEAMLAGDDVLLCLTCRSSIKIAAMHISEPVKDGILVFDRLPFLGLEQITEEYVPVLDLLCEVIGSGTGFREYYTLSKEEMVFSSETASFGLSRDIREGAELIESISRDFSPAEAWRNSTDDVDTVRILLHEEAHPGFTEHVADLLEAIYTAYNMEESNVDGYLISIVDERNGNLCRAAIDIDQFYGSSRHRYTVKVILQGEYLQYQEEFEQVFSSRPFFAERGFDVWAIR